MATRDLMRPAHVIQIETPTKVLLKRASRVVVWVHGLGSSMFSKLEIAGRLCDSKTAVIMFNNRGHDKVTSVSTSTGKRLRAGAVHEVFTDCADDIEGAVRFARGAGAREIFIAGHSTGCQKAVYYASKNPRGIRGIIILGPMSDYSAEKMAQGLPALKRAERVAHAYVGQNKKHALLPEDVWKWPWIADAQRFLSLYTGDSAEEIFTYWDPEKIPKTLRAVSTPILVLLAEKEEFADRPAKDIAAWFDAHVRSTKSRVLVVPKVSHSFKGGEGKAAQAIRKFMFAS